ncbi:MAG: hypothetical protein ACUVRV_03535 [Cyanobacteriota bacterium]
MHKHGVKRIICQTGAMIGEAGQLPFQLRMELFNPLSPELAEDRASQENLAQVSSLN